MSKSSIKIEDAPNYLIDQDGIVTSAKTGAQIKPDGAGKVRLKVGDNRKFFKISELRRQYFSEASEVQENVETPKIIDVNEVAEVLAVDKTKKVKKNKKTNKAPKVEKSKELSRNQMIYLYHKKGKDAEAILKLHSDWSKAHVKNAINFAKNNPDCIEKAVKAESLISKKK